MLEKYLYKKKKTNNSLFRTVIYFSFFPFSFPPRDIQTRRRFITEFPFLIFISMVLLTRTHPHTPPTANERFQISHQKQKKKKQERKKGSRVQRKTKTEEDVVMWWGGRRKDVSVKSLTHSLTLTHTLSFWFARIILHVSGSPNYRLYKLLNGIPWTWSNLSRNIYRS